MPPDLTNDQELMLKKRARRRLVGAIALVLLMVVILPQVLQDRALLAKQEPIKITMPAQVESEYPSSAFMEAPDTDSRLAPVNPAPVGANIMQPSVSESSQEEKAVTSPSKKTDDKRLGDDLPPAQKESIANVAEAAKTDIHLASKSEASFSVQVGVYSDVENVKRIQNRLQQAGFSAQTEKIRTPKGDSLRLKAGDFSSRQDAVNAQAKIKALGLPGIVVTNE